MENYLYWFEETSKLSDDLRFKLVVRSFCILDLMKSNQRWIYFENEIIEGCIQWDYDWHFIESEWYTLKTLNLCEQGIKVEAIYYYFYYFPASHNNPIPQNIFAELGLEEC